MTTISLATVASPAGPLHVAVADTGDLTGIWFGVVSTPADVERAASATAQTVQWNPEPCAEVARQIAEYSSGNRRAFDLPLRFAGSEWEMAVWSALLTIPFGETRSYGQIATQLGDPTKARAVGWANHVNPIPLVIPCHRVIGVRGNLTGFGGGIDAKIKLLAHEGAMLPGFA